MKSFKQQTLHIIKRNVSIVTKLLTSIYSFNNSDILNRLKVCNSKVLDY